MRKRLVSEHEILRPANDAYDLKRHLRARAADFAADVFADRVFTREVLLSQSLINDHDWLGSFHIMVVEESSLAQRNSHRLEVIGTRLIYLRG